MSSPHPQVVTLQFQDLSLVSALALSNSVYDCSVYSTNKTAKQHHVLYSRNMTLLRAFQELPRRRSHDGWIPFELDGEALSNVHLRRVR